MNEHQHSENYRDHLEIPGALLDDLVGLYDRHIDIPTEIDAGVQEAARRHLLPTRRLWMPSIRWAAPLAAAAAIAVIFLSVGRESTRSVVPPLSSGMKEETPNQARDFDGDGRFDIVDVLALAQDVKRGRVIDLQWDVNGDGGIDVEDIDLLGHNVVALY